MVLNSMKNTTFMQDYCVKLYAFDHYIHIKLDVLAWTELKFW